MNKQQKEEYLRDYAIMKSQGKPFFPYAVAKDAAMACVVMAVIITMSPDFVSGRTWQSNITYERALGTNYSSSIGFMYAKGDSMPVISEASKITP